MERLKGKRAVVTGAGSGIGRAIAIRLSEEGARVALADLDLDATKGVAAEIGEAGGEALVVKTDVTRAGEVESLVAAVVEGERAVAAFRQLAGGTDPVDKAAPGSIRGDFALETQYNLVHGSDSVDSAKREIALWFPEL